MDGARSAEPPINSGSLAASTLMTLPEAALEAIPSGRSGRQGQRPTSLRQLAFDAPFKLGSQFGIGFLIGFELCLPGSLKFESFVDLGSEMRQDLFGI